MAEHTLRAPTGATTDTDDETLVRRLVARVKDGDDRAFADLVDTYHRQVVALAYRMVGDYDEAADVAQNTFLKVANNIHRYDEKRRFYTWLYRIAFNAAIDHMRKRRRHEHERLEDYHSLTDSSRPGPESSFNRSRISSHIREAARGLNQKERSAFLLRDIQGGKLDEVAEIMQMKEATVRWYLHRARARIRRELLRKCPQLLIALGIR